VKPGVDTALTELREGSPGDGPQHQEDGAGGAFVLVEGLFIGDCFSPTTSWIGFHITWSHPEADVYPHFIDAGVTYTGGGPAPNQHPDGDLPTSLSRGQTAPGFGHPAIQVSRRSTRWNPDTDTALHKLLRVLEFLRAR
jgi:hypothetical protein